MHLVEAIRLCSLYAVVSHKNKKVEDQEYALRRIFRWYSKTYHTPLHMVDQLPLMDVLTAYWEEEFEGLEAPDLEQAVEEVLVDPEMTRKKQIEEDWVDAEAYEIGVEELEAQNKALKKRKLEEIAAPRKDKAPGMGQLRSPESSLPTPSTKAPEIAMQFVSEEDMDMESDDVGFGLMEPPKKQKY